MRRFLMLMGCFVLILNAKGQTRISDSEQLVCPELSANLFAPGDVSTKAAYEFGSTLSKNYQ